MKNRCVVIAAAPNPEISFIRQSIKTDDFVICATQVTKPPSKPVLNLI